MIVNYYSKDFVLKTKQNRASQVVTSSSYDRQSVEILDELEWDTCNLETRRTKQLATKMYKLKNHIAPDHLAQIFNSTNSMYSYNLRNSNILISLFVPRLNTEAGKNSFHYKGADGIVYQMLLNERQAKLEVYFSHICTFRTMLFYCMIFAQLPGRAFLWMRFCD